MAHELTHIVQQNHAGGENALGIVKRALINRQERGEISIVDILYSGIRRKYTY